MSAISIQSGYVSAWLVQVTAIHLQVIFRPLLRLLSYVCHQPMECYYQPRLIGFWKGGMADVRERKWPVRKKHENPNFASS